MKFGLTQDQYAFIQSTVIEPIELAGGTVWCYGSRARGDHRPFSDVDLMVESSVDLQSEIGVIREQLEKSNFPFKVDLIPFNEFAEAYRPGYQKDKKKMA